MILETSKEARFLIPMAISLGVGVLFASIVTLFIVPANFLILRDLHFIKDVPECEFTEMVPTMTLQPLVENCIKHGLKNTMGRVELKVTRLDECVEIRISDNGAGFDEEIRQKILVPIHTDEIMLSEDKNITEVNKTKEDKKLSDGEMHNGIGIINVLLRLKLYFHRDDVFDIPRSEPGQGATFIIRVPKNV
ncbi:MAG: hypothetical protein IKQ43_10365, partial [Treponema sp.]|nr:hypothetical protein [Treponema sp.]